MTNKIYLVNPPNPCDMKGFPGSLLSLDLWVRKHCSGIESTIIDEEHTSQEDLRTSLETKLAGASEDSYFGITCTTATYQDALETAKAIKQVKPKSKIILGGHHVDGQEQVILDYHPEIDLVVSGEGEKALESILKGVNLENIQGVHYRGKDLATMLSMGNRGVRLTKEELNSLDVSQYNPSYGLKARQFEEQNLVTARGCPMKCAFCAVSNEMATAQDSDLVVSQVDYLIKQNKEKGFPTIIAVQDNFFAQNPKRAKEVAEKLVEYRRRTGNDFEWNMQTRVEQFEDRDFVSLLAKAGCSAAYFGVENFDQRMLRVLNKAHNTESYIEATNRAIQNCFENGIQPHLDMQFGIPGEDKKTQEINEEILRRIGESARKYGKKPIIFPSLSVIYPATAFYKGMMDLGAPRDVYEEFTKWERDNPEYRQMLHGYFAHGNGGIPLGIIDIERLKQGRISINTEELFRVKRYVDKLRSIDTITIHDYTKPTREKD